MVEPPVALPVEKEDPGSALEEPVDDPLPQELLQGLQVPDVAGQDHGQHRLIAQIEDLIEDHPLRVRAELDAHLVDHQQVELPHPPEDLALGHLRIAVESLLDLPKEARRLGEERRPARLDDPVDDRGAEMPLAGTGVPHEEKPGARVPVPGEIVGEEPRVGEDFRLPVLVLAIEGEVFEALLYEAALEHAVLQQAAEAIPFAGRGPLLDLGDHTIPLTALAGELRPVGRLPRRRKIGGMVHEDGAKGLPAVGAQRPRFRGAILSG
jgi:hypothetical protein